MHCQRVDVQIEPTPLAFHPEQPLLLSRAERAHYRLDWQARLVRNARVSTSGQVTIRLFGVPERFATSLGLATA